MSSPRRPPDSRQAIYADTNSVVGVVALLRSQAGSDIISGQYGVGFAAVNVFRVDHTGKGFFDGGTQTGGADFAESVAVTMVGDKTDSAQLDSGLSTQHSRR